MKKIILLGLMVSLFCFSSSAQLPSPGGSENSTTLDQADNAPELVTVISIKGKAKYAKPGSKKFKKIIKGGEILDKGGTICLKKKSSVILLDGNSTATLNSKGKHALSSLQASSAGEDPFLGFLSAASGFGGPGDGDTVKKDTTRGHNPGKGLKLHSPLGGKIPAKPVVFKWTGDSDSGFTINIYDADDKKVFSKESSKNELAVDLNDMKVGETYFWEVSKKGASVPVTSRAAQFNVAASDTAEKVIREAEAADGFQDASDWMKALKKGHALESKKMYYNADRIYRQANVDFPNNDSIKAAIIANATKEKASGMTDD